MRYALPLFALLLSGCATTVTPPQAAPKSAQEALRPYYAALDVKLPKAPANPALSADTIITRFAFGSCLNALFCSRMASFSDRFWGNFFIRYKNKHLFWFLYLPIC